MPKPNYLQPSLHTLPMQAKYDLRCKLVLWTKFSRPVMQEWELFSFVVVTGAQPSMYYTWTMMLLLIRLPSNYFHPRLSSMLPLTVSCGVGDRQPLYQVSALAPLDPAVGRARRIKRVFTRPLGARRGTFPVARSPREASQRALLG